jgi:hypothetical protein
MKKMLSPEIHRNVVWYMFTDAPEEHPILVMAPSSCFPLLFLWRYSPNLGLGQPP